MIDSIRRTVLANQELDNHPQLVKQAAQDLLAYFERKLQLLRPQKPVEQVRSGP